MIIGVFLIAIPSAGATRFETRGLYMQSSTPGATTSYTVSLGYQTPAPVGSVDMRFCIDPIPYMPCVTPPGLDVSNVQLSNQTGETGFTITTRTTDHLVISRTPTMISSPDVSTYTFTGVINPTDTTQPFSIRLASYGTEDASGPQIDFGSVRGTVSRAIQIEAQVPPMLIFCLAQKVDLGCMNTNDTYFTDMGDLSPTSTLTAQSQMAVGTNASGGFVITANGNPPTAGVSVIDGAAVPSQSKPGVNQFGINLVANTLPNVGTDPEGEWVNAVPASDYSSRDMYKYVPGDAVAYSSNVSLMKKFTVSYILNASDSLRPGVYSTTITFVASGRF